MGHEHEHDGECCDHGRSHGGHGHHGHGHGHGHRHVHTNDKRTLSIIALLTGGYMFAEIIGGYLSGSLALLADAGHMALDTVAVVLGLFAAYISQRPPTRDKTFGFYRAEILAALLNAATLIAASGWILYEVWERFREPAEVQGRMMAFVAMGGLAVNGIAIFLMARANRDSLNMRGVWLHLLTDALGSVAAIVAAILVWQFQWYLADPIISAAISLLILRGAWRLMKNCINVLLVAVPDGVSVDDITKDIERVPGVVAVHDVHVWAMNTGVNAFTGHVRIRDGVDHVAVLETTTLVLVEKHDIQHVTIQVEPESFARKKATFERAGKRFNPHVQVSLT